MNTVIKLTSTQAAAMAENLKLIKAEKAILTLNVAPNGKYMQNSLVMANEGEQVQSVIWSTFIEGIEAVKTELIVETNLAQALDTLKNLNSDIEIRKEEDEYFFCVEGQVPKVPIKVLAEKPEIASPDQASLIAQYQVSGKELSTKLAEVDRTDSTAAQEICKAVTAVLGNNIKLVSGDGPTIGRAILTPKAGSLENEVPVAIPAKYIAAIKKVAAMSETISLAVFGSSIAIGSPSLVYMASLGTTSMPAPAIERIEGWSEMSTEASFTVDNGQLEALIATLRIGAGEKKTKPIIVFSNDNGQIQMKGFDGTSVILPCSKIEGAVKTVALNSNLLEKLIKQLKRGNITVSIADDINTPCRIQNGTVAEPVKDSVLFLLKTNLKQAEKDAAAESASAPDETQE